MRALHLRMLLAGLLAASSLPALPAWAQQCPSQLPVQGAPPPAPLPMFPAGNWWNTDVRGAPVDPNSASFIAFINNGGSRRLHPDFGGEESPGSTSVYGFPYAIVGGSQALKAVTFDYADESDGVDHNTGQGVPFYPIPAQAITQAHWVEGGAAGNVDQRTGSDRHLLVIDCTRRYLYELYNVYYDSAQAAWFAGSGAFFDLNRNDRRPEGWTSADAAGLAIFPGLVRYDEAGNAALSDLGHALRVTVRSSNGHVFPGSHTAGSTSGALPMGARLRLKASVNGLDPATRSTDPIARRIFRTMQKYGLIVADNGSDMYISGSFDVRWNNDTLNPAFATLSASDFEVLKLGWQPAAAPPAGIARSVGDFDGDGRFDVLWRNNADGRNTIWRGANAAMQQAVSTLADLHWKVAGIGDFDGDGRDDILWRNNSSGLEMIWRSGNSAIVQGVAQLSSQDWQVAGVGDFNGDRHDDILWRNNRSGINAIWKNGSAQTQQAIASLTNLDWHVLGVGDLDNDGRADILWRNLRSGGNQLWRGGDAASTQALTAMTDLNWLIVAVADFNGDRRSDILWRSRSTGQDVIWRSGLSATPQSVAQLPGQNWYVDGAADYGGDGVADMFWRNHVNGANVIWTSADSARIQPVSAVTTLSWEIVP